MTNEKWQETIKTIKDQFEVDEEFNGEIENFPGATFEGIVFLTPMGKMKATRTKRPKVTDKKEEGDDKTEYILSEDEFVYDVEVHKWNEIQDNWIRTSIDF